MTSVQTLTGICIAASNTTNTTPAGVMTTAAATTSNETSSFGFSGDGADTITVATTTSNETSTFGFSGDGADITTVATSTSNETSSFGFSGDGADTTTVTDSMITTTNKTIFTQTTPMTLLVAPSGNQTSGVTTTVAPSGNQTSGVVTTVAPSGNQTSGVVTTVAPSGNQTSGVATTVAPSGNQTSGVVTTVAPSGNQTSGVATTVAPSGTTVGSTPAPAQSTTSYVSTGGATTTESSTINVTSTAATVVTFCTFEQIQLAEGNFTFNMTAINAVASSTQRCSDGRAIATRVCLAGGAWKEPSVLACSASTESTLSSLANATLSKKAETVFLLSSASNISATDVENIKVFLTSSVATANSTSVSEVNLVIGVVENLQNSTQVGGGSALVELVAQFAIKVELKSGENVTIRSKTLTATVSVVSVDSDATITPVALSSSSDAAISGITIPKSAFPSTGGAPVRVLAMVSDKSLYPAAPANIPGSVTGNVVSLNIGTSSGASKIQNLDPPIEINWDISSKLTSVPDQAQTSKTVLSVCVFLDTTTNTYSQSGIQIAPGQQSSTTQTCQVTHLTSIALISQVTVTPVSSPRPTTIYIVGCAFAIFGLLVVAFVHLLFKQLRNDPLSNMVAQFCFWAAMVFVMFLISSTTWTTLPRPNCLAVASFHHLFLLIALGWLTILSFSAMRSLKRPMEWILLYKQCEQPRRNSAIIKWSLLVYIVAIVLCVVVVAPVVGVVEPLNTNVQGAIIPHANAYASSDACLVKGPALYYGLAIPGGLMLLASLLLSLYATILVSVVREKIEVSFQGYMSSFVEVKQLGENIFMMSVLMCVTIIVGLIRGGWDQWPLRNYVTMDTLFGVFGIILGVLAIIIFCLRTSHVRSLIARGFRSVCPTTGDYYLTDESRERAQPSSAQGVELTGAKKSSSLRGAKTQDTSFNRNENRISASRISCETDSEIREARREESRRVYLQ
nr:uncharacterized protein PB18E9.04c-like [Ciona intestinalis]|eukprot:XP_018668885.2 uncharacterized protein PB18E9.04c-like [Ciona intestinalis]